MLDTLEDLDFVLIEVGENLLSNNFEALRCSSSISYHPSQDWLFRAPAMSGPQRMTCCRCFHVKFRPAKTERSGALEGGVGCRSI